MERGGRSWAHLSQWRTGKQPPLVKRHIKMHVVQYCIADTGGLDVCFVNACRDVREVESVEVIK